MDNPYTNSHFFEFFWVLTKRLLAFLGGAELKLASDELQILVMGTIALTAAIVGTFLTLRKMSMLANALSHTILIGIVTCFLVAVSFHFVGNVQEFLFGRYLFIAAIFSGLFTTFLTELLKKTMNLQEDASIGLVFTSLFALGILLVTLYTKNQHIGIELIMGNVDALKRADLKLVFSAFFLNATLFLLLFKEFKLTTFDAGFAKTLGMPLSLYNLLLMIAASLTIVSALNAVGVLMVLAFFVIPPLIARLFTHNLKLLIAIAAAFGLFTAVIAVALSRYILTAYGIGLSTSGLLVTLMTIFYVGIFLTKQMTKENKLCQRPPLQLK